MTAVAQTAAENKVKLKAQLCGSSMVTRIKKAVLINIATVVKAKHNSGTDITFSNSL